MPYLSRVHFLLVRIIVVYLSNISVADAGLPIIEDLKISRENSFYRQLFDYLNNGAVLGGLILAAVTMLIVGNAIIAVFAKGRNNQAVWVRFGIGCVTWLILMVTAIWLVSQIVSVLPG